MCSKEIKLFFIIIVLKISKICNKGVRNTLFDEKYKNFVCLEMLKNEVPVNFNL